MWVQDDNQITILIVNAPQFLLQFANGTVLLVSNCNFLQLDYTDVCN
jgi:hypothetical protein